MQCLFLKKVGMMQVFDKEGKRIPVTVLQKDVCRVVGLKNMERDGYQAVCVGYGQAGRRVAKPLRGVFAKAKVDPTRRIREVRVNELALELGQELSVDVFSEGDRVDAVGRSKGSGFTGVMKRHNFAGLVASHGVSVSHRSGGSTGQHQDPGRVFKGKKMAGQCGNKRVTVQNLTVYSVRKDKEVLLVAGSIPGPCGEYIMLKKAVKA
ncbi:MAG: 50S ribosomal protein L3 [Alphaproteobacteria bacterium]|nr:50S ribosomal protein L3 [Alphaproteobacteria bacterium]